MISQKITSDLKNFNNIKTLQNPITFFGSARLDEGSEHYEMARKLAFNCVEAGFSIVSGAGGGIMQAANLGAFEACKALNLDPSEKSIGFNIHLPFEQKSNDFVGYNLTFENLAIRKMALIDKSLAFVIFAGGFGTLDEFVEVLTLKQLGFKKVPIFLVGSAFWKRLDEFIKHTLLELQVISKGDETLYQISDDLDFILDELKQNIFLDKQKI